MVLQKEKQIEYIDKIMDWCFMGLVFILPFAHTMTIRSIFIFLPVFLWLYKMVLKREVLFVNNQMAIPLSLFAIVAIWLLTKSNSDLIFIFLPVFLWLYKMVLKREVLFVNNQMAIPLSLFAIVAIWLLTKST